MLTGDENFVRRGWNRVRLRGAARRSVRLRTDVQVRKINELGRSRLDGLLGSRVSRKEFNIT